MKYDTRLTKLIKCIYSLQGTELNVLNVVLSSEKPLKVEDISQKLNVSKALVNKSLARLVSLDIVKRSKIQVQKIGRPVYEYWIDKQQLLERVIKEVDSIISLSSGA